MKANLLASDLGFPEGPVVMLDGRIVFCDGNVGELLAYESGKVGTFARMGGSPWGAVLGTDGAVYVTQGGNVPGSGDTSAISGIQRVTRDGKVELLRSEVAGHKLYGPNDLAFGPDGRLYFTDSGSEGDYRFDVRSPGRLFVIDGHVARCCSSCQTCIPMASHSTPSAAFTGRSRWPIASAASRAASL